MKRSTVMLSAAALALVALTGGPAHADSDACQTSTGGTSCLFRCTVNNNIHVDVTGIGTGLARCANLVAQCTSPNGSALNCGAWGNGHVEFNDSYGTCGFVGVGIGTVRCYAV
jgi:hypothetical protein